MAGPVADPIGDVAQTAQNATNKITGGVRQALSSTYNYVVKPAALTYGALSAYSWFDGGVGALAGVGAEGATVKDMIQVPLEGFTELTEDIGQIADKLTSFGQEAANSDFFMEASNG